jgi:Tfp pilus assembly protein PilO
MNYLKNESKTNYRRRTLTSEMSIGPLTLRFITVIIIAALCILYLAQSTQGATQNYQLRELEQKKQEMDKENEQLQIEAVRLQALKNVDINHDKVDEEKNFENISEMDYLE